jgi:hypothetical protein
VKERRGAEGVGNGVLWTAAEVFEEAGRVTGFAGTGAVRNVGGYDFAELSAALARAGERRICRRRRRRRKRGGCELLRRRENEKRRRGGRSSSSVISLWAPAPFNGRMHASLARIRATFQYNFSSRRLSHTP